MAANPRHIQGCLAYLHRPPAPVISTVRLSVSRHRAATVAEAAREADLVADGGRCLVDPGFGSIKAGNKPTTGGVRVHLNNRPIPQATRNPLKSLVGVRGFEPPAPASRTQCSTRLSYTPAEARI